MINTIIIDDENLALIRMKTLLSAYKHINLLGEFESLESAMSTLNKGHIKLVFLDIEMPTTNGLEAGHIIKESGQNIDIVYCTSYSEYALDAFKVHAFDYLLKPVFKERLDTLIKDLYEKYRIEEDPKFKIQFFGLFQVLDTHGHHIKWRTLKAKELFAFLCMHKGHFVSKDRILSEVFNDKYTSYNIVHTTVSYIRSALKQLSHHDMLISKSGNYKVNDQFFDMDTDHFRVLCQSNDINYLEDGLKLYKHGYLRDEAYEWSMYGHEEYKLLYEDLVLKYTTIVFQKNNHKKAIPHLKKMADSNEYESKTQVLLLKAYLATRDYQAFRDYIVELTECYNQDLGMPLPNEILNLIQENKDSVKS